MGELTKKAKDTHERVASLIGARGIYHNDTFLAALPFFASQT